jgi:hypothetical protein
MPNVTEAFGQKLGITFPEFDVVGRCGIGFETNGVANDKSRRLRFRLSEGTRGVGTAIPAMHEWCSEYANELTYGGDSGDSNCDGVSNTRRCRRRLKASARIPLGGA